MRAYLLKSVLLIIGLYIVSCTPKVKEVITEPELVEDVVKEKMPENPCTTLNELSHSKRDKVETAYVLYKDQVKLKKYEKAFPLWKVAYYGAPAANGSIKYQFEDGIAIYKHFYEQAESASKKSAMVDTIMQLYDKRIECFGEADYVAGRKAFDYYYYFNTEASNDKIYGLFKEAMDGKKEKTDYFVINPFTKILTDKIINKEINLDEGRKYTDLIWQALEYGNASGKNKEAWTIINSYAPARLENLEGIKGLYDCAYYEEKYLQLLVDAPDDCEVISRVYSRLLWGGCNPSSESVRQAKSAKETKCYTPPPPVGPLRLAFNAYNEGKYYEAVQLFEDFVAKTDDVQKKAKYSLVISKIYFRDIKNFPKSRKFALESAKYNPSSGAPHLLIGNLYASSGPLCGPGTGWDSQIVTWPAIDAWEKATSDPQTSEDARKLIRTYKQYMPKKEDIFIRGLKAGATYKVGCWINRSTKIRTAD